jgi:pimeloyl-ACP methyl ester carboxylesterase
VEWDQRGSGKTYELNDPAKVEPTMHVERMIQDAEELVAYLRATYHKPKVFVLAHSWGTAVGLSLAERKPEWLYAYVGAGQIINMAEGEKANYAWLLNTARNKGDQEAVKELEAIAPYPEPDGGIPLEKIGADRKWVIRYGGLTHNRSSYDYFENAEKISPDYSEADFKAIDEGSGFSLPKLLPELAKVDFTKLTKLDCPVVLLEGRWDYTTPSEVARRWFERVQAPGKRFVWFDNSAHMMYVEEPGRVLLHLVQDVRPYAAADGDAPPEGK